MKTAGWLSSEEALTVLPVRAQTLYANVSRGRVRAKPDPGDSRRSLYHRGDLERLATRTRGRPSQENVAAEAIHWGAPVLPSSITTVDGGRLFYRGRDAALLARTQSLEEVAAWLWEGPVAGFTAAPGRTPRASKADTPAARALLALAARAGIDPPSARRGAAALRTEAAALVGALADALLGAGEGPLHRRAASAWGRPRSADALRRAMVLLADHELNVSTFAVRVTVSSGASLSAALLAGLAALTGPLHGGAAGTVLALADEARRHGADAALRAWLAAGRSLYAFGHPLYPAGDPRCEALLSEFKMPSEFASLRTAGERLIGEPPNIDFALAAMTRAHGLPSDAPFVLFALGRSIGWVAHAIEQQGAKELIRPRARYVGTAPGMAPI